MDLLVCRYTLARFEYLVLVTLYALSLLHLKRFEEAKSLLRRSIPVARRALGDNHELMLRMRTNYAAAMVNDTDATLDDLREAVTTLEETAPIARRVLGTTHPTANGIGIALETSRAALRARETPSPGSA